MSLVPLAGRRLATLSIPQARALNTAYSLGRFAYNNRASIARAARAMARGGRYVGRKYKRYKARRSSKYGRPKKKMRLIGNRPGSSTAKKRLQLFDSQAQGLSTRTLYSHSLTEVPAQTTADEIDARNRDVVNLRGVKFCWEVRHSSNIPMYMNWAVVSPRAGNSIDSTDFFRAYTGTRNQDFSVSLSSNELHCLPINTDKYIIFTHKRYRMAALDSITYQQNRGATYLVIQKYLKIKRQLRFDGIATTPEGRSLFVVYWFDQFMRDINTAPVQNVFVNRRIIQYFREPRN